MFVTTCTISQDFTLTMARVNAWLGSVSPSVVVLFSLTTVRYHPYNIQWFIWLGWCYGWVRAGINTIQHTDGNILSLTAVFQILQFYLWTNFRLLWVPIYSCALLVLPRLIRGSIYQESWVISAFCTNSPSCFPFPFPSHFPFHGFPVAPLAYDSNVENRLSELALSTIL